jgi:hypothetical protein
MMPHQLAGSISAAPTGPGSRPQPRAQGLDDARRAGGGVAGREHHPGGGQRRQHRVVHLLRCQGQQNAPLRQLRGQARQPGGVLRLHGADVGGIVHAGTARADERPFQVQPEHPPIRPRRRLPRRGEGQPHRLWPVGDQRWQQAGGAEAPMRRGDRQGGLGGRAFVEQHPAAAVHLHIDEAGHQQAAGRQDVDGHVGGPRVRQDVADELIGDRHGQPVLEAGVDQYARAAQGEGHQSVSVTLRRCGGLSGSNPRRRAICAMAK